MTSLLRTLTRVLPACLALALLTPGGARAQVEVVGERVIGGEESRPNAWPFQAYIQIRTERGTAACGGTLVAPGWVLTAAHCVVDGSERKPRQPEAFSVRLGSVTRSNGGEVHVVKRVLSHDGYSARFNYENDIALLQLAEPSRLPFVGLEGGSPGRVVASGASPWAKVIGWGLTNVAQHLIPERLQEASLPLVESERCNTVMGTMFPKSGPIDGRRICAGSSEGGIDSCNGDSGGPLLVSDGRGGWLQVGVVSYGVTDCGRANAFGVYTRVASFSSWIGERTAKTSDAPPPPQSAAKPAPIALGVPGAAPTITASAAQATGRVRAILSKRALKLGDRFDVSVTSSFDGYLLLFDLNTNNQLTQIFPNPRSALANKQGAVRAGATLRIPDASYGFALEASEPRGRGRLLAVVASDPAALATFRSSEGFTTLANADERMARLDLVLKSQAPGKTWAASMTDYVVR